METTAAVAPRRARRPLAALGKLTVASLIGGALLVGSDLFYHGMEALAPVLVLSTVVLVPAAIIATGWRWAPLLGALVYVPSLVLAYPDMRYLLARPHETYLFSFMVLFLALGIVGTGAGIGATVQNYRGGERRAPRWLPAALCALAGLALGAILVAVFAQVGPTIGVSRAVLADLPALTTTGNVFDRTELRARVGETIALRLENRDVSIHSFDIDEFALHAPMPSGESSLALFRATAPGVYTFYCAVPGHADKAAGEGMLGTLIVEP